MVTDESAGSTNCSPAHPSNTASITKSMLKVAPVAGRVALAVPVLVYSEVTEDISYDLKTPAELSSILKY